MNCEICDTPLGHNAPNPDAYDLLDYVCIRCARESMHLTIGE